MHVRVLCRICCVFLPWLLRHFSQRVSVWLTAALAHSLHANIDSTQHNALSMRVRVLCRIRCVVWPWLLRRFSQDVRVWLTAALAHSLRTSIDLAQHNALSMRVRVLCRIRCVRFGLAVAAFLTECKCVAHGSTSSQLAHEH